jgi:hypothetical protein
MSNLKKWSPNKYEAKVHIDVHKQDELMPFQNLPTLQLF